MSKKLKFIWIDDDSTREPDSISLGKRLNVTIKFESVKNKNLSERLEAIQKKDQPDLLIIDHKLEDVSSGIFRTGSTAAAFIREKWPTCPIICITGVEKDEVDTQQQNLYEEMFPYSKISKHDSTIISIAKSFKILKEKPPQNINEILDLLKCPKDEYEKLSAIIPQEIKLNQEDKSYNSEISHWIRKILIERPGFLYDKLWVATLIGIKETSFHKIENLFKAAKYKGIFNDESNERWWRKTIIDILSKEIKGIGLPWEKGRKLKSIAKKDFSKCYATDKDFPEIVAFVDETLSSSREPMRIESTIPHPSYQNMLFFEEIRMMKSDI